VLAVQWCPLSLHDEISHIVCCHNPKNKKRENKTKGRENIFYIKNICYLYLLYLFLFLLRYSNTLLNDKTSLVQSFWLPLPINTLLKDWTCVLILIRIYIYYILNYFIIISISMLLALFLLLLILLLLPLSHSRFCFIVPLIFFCHNDPSWWWWF
jgi:hypothetical protein